jgi:hypothetical protein
MNLLEHYIIEVIKITDLDVFDSLIEVKVLCDCWGNKRVYNHVTTRENWERELKQGYFLA